MGAINTLHLCFKHNLSGILDHFLTTDDVLHMALTSKDFFDAISPFISSTYYFNILSPSQNFKYYHPHGLKYSIDKKIKYFPPSVTHFIFWDEFNRSVDHLPVTITYLNLGSKTYTHPKDHHNDPTKSTPHKKKNDSLFNIRIDYLPHSITHLLLGCNFNQPIDFLPTTITYLSIGGKFNQSVDNLPPLLTHFVSKNIHVKTEEINSNEPVPFTIMGEFNQPIDNLPITLTNLVLEGNFNQSINHLPPSLKDLFLLCLPFNQSLDNLPNLRKLSFCSAKFDHPVDHLPSSLIRLNMAQLSFQSVYPHYVDNLPPKIEQLDLLIYKFNKPLDHLPNSISHLIMFSGFNLPVGYLPSSLTYLDLENAVQFNQPIDHLPSSIKHLKLGPPFVHAIPTHLPDLTHLTLGNVSPHCLSTIPSTVTHLSFGDNFNKSVGDSLLRLPPHVKNVTFGLYFTMPIDSISPSITSLNVPWRYKLPLSHLPPSVKVKYWDKMDYVNRLSGKA